MFYIELPEELRAAIDDIVVPSKKVAAASAEMSVRYRTGYGTSLQSKEDVAAYAAYRMPATFAAVSSALIRVREVLPDWNPRTLLDAGAGPGTSMWAAMSIWPSLERITLLERDDKMIDIGRKVSARSSSDAIRDAEWIKTDLTDLQSLGASDSTVAVADFPPPHDLIILAYVLGELPGDRISVLKRLWQATLGVFLIVEPGTPVGFANVRAARDSLLSCGGNVAAPCPHSGRCPMGDKDWCHFSQRVARSRLHRQAKAGELGYEDEKFSFVAVSRAPGRTIAGRVIRHPQVRPGHIRFEVCTPYGLERPVVTRKDRDLYRMARDTEWGSVMPGADPKK